MKYYVLFIDTVLLLPALIVGMMFMNDFWAFVPIFAYIVLFGCAQRWLGRQIAQADRWGFVGAPIPMPLTVNVGDVVWSLYSVDYNVDSKTYCTYVYAKSDEHAEVMVHGLRETGRVDGKLTGWRSE